MNKKHLVMELTKVVGSRRKAGDAVSCILRTITKALRKGDALTLAGFGTFKVSKRKSRVGRNPLTGKELNIPAKNVPKFTPGKSLKNTLN